MIVRLDCGPTLLSFCRAQSIVGEIPIPFPIVLSHFIRATIGGSSDTVRTRTGRFLGLRCSPTHSSVLRASSNRGFRRRSMWLQLAIRFTFGRSTCSFSLRSSAICINAYMLYAVSRNGQRAFLHSSRLVPESEPRRFVHMLSSFVYVWSPEQARAWITEAQTHCLHGKALSQLRPTTKATVRRASAAP